MNGVKMSKSINDKMIKNFLSRTVGGPPREENQS